MNTVKKTGGFTLVELIIVIAILAILSSVAVAGYSSYIAKANESADTQVINNLAQHVILANAQGGAIDEIEIAADGTVTVYAEKFDTTNFATDLKNAYGVDATVTAADGKATFSIDIAFKSAKYAKGATWTNGNSITAGVNSKKG